MSRQTAPGPAGDGRARRRVLLVAFASVATFLLAASVAWACTTYWGQTTIENLTTDSGEFTVVADPTSGMDRCDEAMDSGPDGANTIETNDDDTIRVEISMWEPNGQDVGTDPDGSENPCNVSNYGDNDGDGHEEHSLADDEDQNDETVEDVYINSYDGTAYTDENDTDSAYDDTDDLNLALDGNEDEYDPSSERDGDCMGDGDSDGDGNPDSQGPVINYKGPDGTHDAVAVNGDGEFDKSDDDVTRDGPNEHDGSNGDSTAEADEDDDGINDVDITFSESSRTAQAICVSEGDGGDSAPQIPIETT